MIRKNDPMHENKGKLYTVVNKDGIVKYINKDEIDFWELKGFIRGRK